MKVPKKFVNALRKKLGLSYNTVYNWSKYEVPESRVAEIEPVLAKIEQDREDVTVDSWMVTPLYKFMNLPRATVRGWHKYGVPANRAEEVKKAIQEMNDDERRID